MRSHTIPTTSHCIRCGSHLDDRTLCSVAVIVGIDSGLVGQRGPNTKDDRCRDGQDETSPAQNEEKEVLILLVVFSEGSVYHSRCGSFRIGVVRDSDWRVHIEWKRNFYCRPSWTE